MTKKSNQENQRAADTQGVSPVATGVAAVNEAQKPSHKKVAKSVSKTDRDRSGEPLRGRGRPMGTAKKPNDALIIAGQQFVWKIATRMAERGVASVTDLHAKLERVDPDCVTYTQLAEFIQARPNRINSRTLMGVAIVLNCGIADLMGLEPLSK